LLLLEFISPIRNFLIYFFYDEVSWGKNKPFFLNKEIKTTFFLFL